MASRKLLPVFQEELNRREREYGPVKELKDPIKDVRGPREVGEKQAKLDLEEEQSRGSIRMERVSIWRSKEPGEIKATVVTPKDPGDNLSERPCITFLHSGLLMGYDEHVGLELWGPLLALEFGAVVISPGYRRVPDNHGLELVQDCYDAVHWAWKNVQFHPEKFFLFGASAGGLLAACTTTLAVRTNEFKLGGLILEAPMLDPACDSESMEELSELNHYLHKQQVEFGWEKYLEGETSEDAIPVKATLEDIEKFPPTFVASGISDPLNSEARAFAGRREDFVLWEAQGSPHGFHMIKPKAPVSIGYKEWVKGTIGKLSGIEPIDDASRLPASLQHYQ
ncbi:AB hydrolase superfamily protein [Apiospora marii]|uniref:AB hydrolase superfamily protein n=1 Tax=Apiospora marii TaxID=335849 RepID=A0ABR1SPA6_9PEZI